MSRASIVGMLVAAEVLIAGMAIYSVGHGSRAFGAGMHRIDFTGVAFGPVAAGAAPHVVVDDANSRVHVATSSDGQVHVRDLTHVRGAFFSSANYPQLRVTRTPDGVRIERPRAPDLSIDIFGMSTQAIEVDVPPGSRLEIAQCAGADVYGIDGGVSVHSLDGHVTLTDLQGSIDAHSDDGYLQATNVHGDRLTMESSDGHLALANVTAASLVGTTRDGRIEADGLNVTGDATLQTNDGSVQARFAPDASVTVDASTSDGRISVDGSSFDHDDSAQRTIRIGAGAGRMKLATDEGSIHIFTNGDSR
jgi:Putative adhesin